MQGSTSMSDDGVYEHDFGIPLQPEAGPSSGKQQTKNGKVKYTRKRTGCLTCRGRKKRCSEEHPVCAVCQRLKLECVWPDPEDTKHRGGRKRRASHANTTDDDDVSIELQYGTNRFAVPPVAAPVMGPGAYVLPPQHHPAIDPRTAAAGYPPPIEPLVHPGYAAIDPSLAGIAHLNHHQHLSQHPYPPPSLQLPPVNNAVNGNHPPPPPPIQTTQPSTASGSPGAGHAAWDSLLKGVDAASYAQAQQISPASTVSPVLTDAPSLPPRPTTSGATSANSIHPQTYPSPQELATNHMTPLSSSFFSTILKYPQQQMIHAHDQNKKGKEQQQQALTNGSTGDVLAFDDLFSWQSASPGDSPRVFEINTPKNPEELKSSFLFDFVQGRSPTPPSTYMPSLSRPLSPAFVSSVGNFLSHALTSAPPQIPAESALVNTAESDYTKSFLLNHYTQGLAKLVSVAADSANLFLILMPFARQHSYLMLSILAWSAANLCAAGPANISLGEIADKYTAQAVEQLDSAITEGRTEWEVVLGTILMLVQVAICRGDVGTWKSRLKQAAGIIQQHAPYCHQGLGKMLVKNFIYHDVLSSSSAKEGSMLDYQAFAASAPTHSSTDGTNGKDTDEVEIDVLMGVAEPVFLLIGRVSDLLIKKRRLSTQYGRLEDTELLEFHAEADEIKIGLEKERLSLEALLMRRPDLEPHRAFHEAYRLAAELYLNMTLSLPALSMPMLYLTRRLLATVEKIDAQSLPGHCSMHWTIYMMQLNATPLRSSSSLLTDQERAQRANDSFYSKFHFLNVPRSRTVVKAVWERNEGGQRFVEPHDILNQWGWELNWA